MRFLNQFIGVGLEAELIIEHRGEQLGWSVKNYRYFKPSDETVLDINNYWARLPSDTQDEIFALYKDIRNAFFDIINPRELDDYLRDRVKDLYALMPRDQAETYINVHSDIWYPETMKDDVDKYNGEAESLTYKPQDYKDLAVFTMMLKAALPIVGQYILTVSPMIEENRREGLAIKILEKANIIEYPALKRLLNYCHFFYFGDNKEMAGNAILSGLASTQVDEWLMTQVIYKQLIAGKLSQRRSSEEPICHVRKLFSQVKPLTDDLGRYAGFGERVSDKPFSSDGAGTRGDEDKTSIIESYKTKQDIRESLIVMHEVSAHNPKQFLSRIDPTCPFSLFEESLAMIVESDLEATQLHKILVQWCLSPIISAEAVRFVDYKGICHYMAATQALLYHWGFPSIGQLMSCGITKLNVRMLPQVKTPMSVEQLDLLDKYYPHFQSQVTIRTPSRTRRNFVAFDIENINKDFGSKYWLLNIPSYFDNHLQNGNPIPTPFDFEYELARLVIYLNERPQPEVKR